MSNLCWDRFTDNRRYRESVGCELCDRTASAYCTMRAETGRDIPACELHDGWIERDGEWYAPGPLKASEAECLCRCGKILPWSNRGENCSDACWDAQIADWKARHGA